MTNRKEAQVLTDYLNRGCAYYRDLGIPAAVSKPTEEAPYTALILLLDEIGEDNRTIRLEMSFIPGLDEADQAGVYLLQTFAEIAPAAAGARRSGLLETIAEINATLPIGAFGVFPDGGPLYYKHNAMMKSSWMLEPSAIEQLDRQNGLILYLLHQYVDRFA